MQITMEIKKQKRENFKFATWVVLAIAILILLSSCSSRKVNKSEIKEEAKTTLTDNTKTETTATENTKVIDTSTIDEIEIVPIDNTKEITVNGKKYTNVKLRLKKTKNKLSVETNKKVAQIEQKAVKIESKATKVEMKKQSERKGFNFLSLWWLWLLLILAGVVYYFRKQIPFI